MRDRVPLVDPDTRAWIDDQIPGTPLLERLEAHASEVGFPKLGRASGELVELLSRSIGATRVLELGSGFGYSAWFFARAVGPGGQVVCTEKDQHELDAHERLWAGSPLKERVVYRLGSALESAAAESGPFDVVLIDLNKASYLAAWELAVDKVRPGGLILSDNVLWGGRVAHPPEDDSTEALQAFNARIRADDRVQTTVVPVGDGLAISRRV